MRKEDSQNLKPKNIHKDHRQRMKETFLKNGFDGFSNIEIMEFMLFFGIPFKDTNPVSHELFNSFMSIKDIIDAPYEVLKDIKGMGEHSALFFKALQSFVNVYCRPDEKEELNSTYLCQEYCKKLFIAKDHEELYLLCINPNNTVKNIVKVASGTLREISVDINDLIRHITNNKVDKIILCHNHPRGLNHPSDEDVKFTIRALKALGYSNIEILDHVIVGGSGTYSMAEHQIISRTYKDYVMENTKMLSVLNQHREKHAAYVLSKIYDN